MVCKLLGKIELIDGNKIVHKRNVVYLMQAVFAILHRENNLRSTRNTIDDSITLEETIKKSHIVDSDRFVFSIDTASKLPNFPFNYNLYNENRLLVGLLVRYAEDIKVESLVSQT